MNQEYVQFHVVHNRFSLLPVDEDEPMDVTDDEGADVVHDDGSDAVV